ncbi:hypothetical protein PS925_05142 [Pseudomonas fluorescens]|jgi:hypothetical protein|uniref:Uncharacterized protein n=2 Tax=Pseudomonas TaxID=286 RepID=A0A5E6YHX5_PSEFL|nr:MULTISPECIES: DUF4123 domain-containing protein [Pseudomonas]PYC20924.1 DUF4123 domain-containing protein [Pseudomonas jessenii]PNG41929.1 hypothetical protein A1354_27380 [Pseudomonas asplenii]QXI06907.1 DUF4123 domain-containing protein [Pseudomonas tensinigenes]VVM58128.1 hypothetical protein PS619_01143 [Pseudomonas fluorescens]VVM95997.1 hypothetical protein PS681_03059 [Pseudomonas fluorescens]
MSGAAREPMAQWLLLDGPDATRALTILRQGFADAQRFWLFDGTEFAPVCEYGPVLVDLRGCPALASLCYSDPDTWRGLLLASEASAQDLLSHLQCMLTVSFGLSHRALLSYYNRQTASYFFDACDAADLSRWLGPIRQLRWFGGTWADRAIGSQGWQQLRNPGLAVEPLSVEESLTRRQRERLQTCLLEQHIWRWCQSLGTDYAAMASHVQQGLALGFSDRSVLDAWLWLRLLHPRAVLVPPPEGLTQQERLEHVRRQWRGDQT